MNRQLKASLFLALVYTQYLSATELKVNPIEGTESNISAKLPDGSTYYGDIKDRRFDDVKGRLVWENGREYVGGFKNGFIHGIGKQVFANGAKYKGEFKNGMSNGYGIFTFANGDKYEGFFKNDLFDGKGSLTYANGDGYYGYFKKDIFHGKGTLHFTLGDIVSFEGLFSDNIPKTGELVFSNGDIYTGEVNQELYPHGNGSYIFYNKDKEALIGLFDYGVLLKNKAQKLDINVSKPVNTH